ncbi:MAG: class I SAM-dependent methyltransferase [Candidatus Eremiobacteraeota bacterium]|nr:class I SAM-dependent methyltransferase [Candidatus Eremiobacteraeota bacterium]
MRVREIYERRFRGNEPYRDLVWRKLVERVFQPLVPEGGTILDLGCGYGEFINNVRAARRYAMDANPAARERLRPGVEFIEQDCSQRWGIPTESLDVVFSSNFFEHLPSKEALQATLGNAYSAIKPGGRLISLGPNIRYLPGAYWDFIDHHVPLSDRSALEALELAGFVRESVIDRFLPYTMSDGGRTTPIALVDLYLRVPLFWRFFGKQFLIVARKE